MIERTEEYKKIGDKLVRKLPKFDDLRESGARIAYLLSDTEKKQDKKTVFADCRKVAPQYSWCCHYDFMITVYSPNVVYFTEKQKEILMEHELMHCGVDQEGNEPSFYIVPHDIEEFYDILDKYGEGWQKKEGD